MAPAETTAYIAPHLNLAGPADTLFSDDATTLIHRGVTGPAPGDPRASERVSLLERVGRLGGLEGDPALGRRAEVDAAWSTMGVVVDGQAIVANGPRPLGGGTVVTSSARAASTRNHVAHNSTLTRRAENVDAQRQIPSCT